MKEGVTFIKLNSYVIAHPEVVTHTDMACMECREHKAEEHELLGVDLVDCSDVCDEEETPKTLADLEGNLNNLKTRPFVINVFDIRSFTQSEGGRLILEWGSSGTGQVFADKYEDFLVKFEKVVNIV